MKKCITLILICIKSSWYMKAVRIKIHWSVPRVTKVEEGREGTEVPTVGAVIGTLAKIGKDSRRWKGRHRYTH